MLPGRQRTNLTRVRHLSSMALMIALFNVHVLCFLLLYIKIYFGITTLPGRLHDNLVFYKLQRYT